MAMDSNVGTALGAMAGVFGKHFQAKLDQEHEDKKRQAELIAGLVSGGLQAGTIKNPNEAFQFMLDQFKGGGKGKSGGGGGKGAKGQKGELPGPLKMMIGATQQAGAGAEGGASQSGAPQFKTGAEQDEESIAREGKRAGAVTEAQYSAKLSLARRMVADGVVKDIAEGLERVGLKEPVQHLAPPKPFGKPVPSTEVEPGAKNVDGTTLTAQEGNYYQPVIISTPQGPETRYQPGAPPPPVKPSGSPILKGMSPALKARIEDRLASTGVDPNTATDDQVKRVMIDAGKAGMKGEEQKGTAAAELDELRKLNIQLAQQKVTAGGNQSGFPGATGPDGEELPLVTIGADGRPDPAQQAELLSKFPQDIRAALKGLADYTINPTTYSARTTKSGAGGQPTRAQMVAWVKQYDPSYDEKQYPVRQKLESDWSSGKTRDAMVATNTVVRHMQEMYKAAKALAPYTYGVEEANRAAYGIRRRTNAQVRDAIRDFETARDAVALELRKVYSGTSGGSQKEIEDWQQNASTTAPTDEKLTFLKTASRLMFGRINAAVDSYKGTMGKAPKPGLGFTQSSINALKALGIDTADVNPAIKPGDPEGIR